MSKRFLFFGTGANFTIAVINRLIALNRLPFAIVVPEYPPIRSDTRFPVELPSKENPLIKKADEINIKTLYLPQMDQSGLIQQLDGIDIDFILVACWPYLLSKEVCLLAGKAALNLHPSLLPKFRGANPVEQQLATEDREFGASLHYLNDRFDRGDIVKQVSFTINDSEDLANIEKRAAQIGADLFNTAIEEFGTRAWQPVKQQ